jgi:hypothetical protein
VYRVVPYNVQAEGGGRRSCCEFLLISSHQPSGWTTATVANVDRILLLPDGGGIGAMAGQDNANRPKTKITTDDKPRLAWPKMLHDRLPEIQAATFATL